MQAATDKKNSSGFPSVERSSSGFCAWASMKALMAVISSEVGTYLMSWSMVSTSNTLSFIVMIASLSSSLLHLNLVSKIPTFCALLGSSTETFFLAPVSVSLS